MNVDVKKLTEMVERELNRFAETFSRLTAAKTFDSDILFGTVLVVSQKTLIVNPDDSAKRIKVVRACNPKVGQKVVIQKKHTIWLATAVIEGSIDFISDLSSNRNPASDWVWEKHDSGRSFARRLFTFTGIKIETAWGTGGYYASAISFGSFPTGLFSSAPTVCTQTHHTSAAGVNTYSISATSAGTGEIFSYKSYSGLVIPISYLAFGNWK